MLTPKALCNVTLLDPANSKSLDQSINADIVSEGMAMVPPQAEGMGAC